MLLTSWTVLSLPGPDLKELLEMTMVALRRTYLVVSKLTKGLRLRPRHIDRMNAWSFSHIFCLVSSAIEQLRAIVLLILYIYSH